MFSFQNDKEYASATCDKLYQSKETVTMTRYGFAFFAMSFMLKKMEEEAEKCRLWSKREITEIIKVFPDDADKDKVKDIVAKMAFARKPLVRMSDYLTFLQEATSHGMEMVSVTQLDPERRLLVAWPRSA